MPLGYRIKRETLQKAAIDRGIRPSATQIASVTGIAPSTLMSVFAGRPASSGVIAAVTHYFGGTPDDWFSLVELGHEVANG